LRVEIITANGTGVGAAGGTFDTAISNALTGSAAGLQGLSDMLRNMVGFSDANGDRVNGPVDGAVDAADGDDAITPSNFLSHLEQLMDLGMGVLATVNLESNAMWFQIGPNAMQGMILQLKGMHTGVLGGARGDLSMLIDVRENSGETISEQLLHIDRAEGIVNAQRAQLGAVQNRLEFTRQSLDISSENLSAAESRIRDTDMAREMMRFTQAQVLQQAGISMLAQANQLPSSILQLLQ
jgi:flagellin